jgi:hypothetical protein
MSGATQHLDSDTRASASRALAGWTLLAAVLSFAALATPFFLGRVYVADDLGQFHLPVRGFYSDQLARGESFDWMPGLFGGFYLTGEGQLGAYHPGHWLLYRWLPLGAAFDLELLASYPILFVGIFLFLRRWQLGVGAALFGALAFTFGSFNLLHFVHPNAVAIVAHLPWLLCAVELGLSDERSSQRALAGLAVGLLVASQLLLGYPQYVWLSGLLVAAYAVWRAITLRAAWTRVAWLMAAGVLGTMMAGVQLLPTYDLLGGSVRRAPDPNFANTGSLHPLNLIQLLAPYLIRTRVVGQNTHELGLYLGAAPALLCLWLLTQRRHWGRFASLVWASIAFGLAGLLLAMGESGMIYRIQQWLPVVNRFRFPCRAIVLVQISAAVAAAVAMNLLAARSRDASPHGSRSGVLSAAVVASVLLAIVGPMAWPEFVAESLLVWCGPLLIATAACLIGLAERGARGALVAIVLLTAVDLAGYGLSYSVYRRTADLHEFVGRVPRPPRDANLRIAMPDDGGMRSGDRTLLAGLTRIDGYAGLEPARALDYTDEQSLRWAGVGWILRCERVGDETRDQWTAVPTAAARARLLRWADSPAREPLSDDNGTVAVLVDRPGRFLLETRSRYPAVLATTESFHGGWQATVDREPATVVRVNHDFLGCEVPEGQHQVELVFRPDSLRMGIYLSASGLGLMVCAVVAQLFLSSSEPRSRHVTSPSERGSG